MSPCGRLSVVEADNAPGFSPSLLHSANCKGSVIQGFDLVFAVLIFVSDSEIDLNRPRSSETTCRLCECGGAVRRGLEVVEPRLHET